MSLSSKDTVKKGYDAISFLYRKDDERPSNYSRWISELLTVLPAAPKQILDLGCGCGVPVSRDLVAAGYQVTGVDISEVQISRAKELVPKGTFIRGDITSTEVLDAIDTSNAGGNFGAVVALYVLIHLPYEEQAEYVRRIAEWVEDGGFCIATVGVKQWTGEESGWLGSGNDVRMWWSQGSVDEYREWARAAGFEIVKDEHVPEEGNDGHQFLLLRKLSPVSPPVERES